MIRSTSTALALFLALGCGSKQDQGVSIVPSSKFGGDAMPVDPFGASSPAYEELKEVTDAALANLWDGELESFADWLEQETVAVERALRMMKSIRVGPQDVYAVSNGRIASLYEHIAGALTEATLLAESQGHVAEWTGQEALIWQQAAAFWARCVRGCGTSGPHLDAWDLRCRAGLAHSEAKSRP